MNNKGIILGIFSLAVVGTVAYGVGVFASQTQGRGMMGQFGANSAVSEQDSARFTQMHNLMVEGKVDEANAIRADLGLGQGNGNGMMGGRVVGNSGQRGQNRGGNFVDANNDGICDHMQQL